MGCTGIVSTGGSVGSLGAEPPVADHSAGDQPCGCGGPGAGYPFPPRLTRHVCGDPACRRCAATAHGRRDPSFPAPPHGRSGAGRTGCGTSKLLRGELGDPAAFLSALSAAGAAVTRCDQPLRAAPARRSRGPHALLDAFASEKDFDHRFFSTLAAGRGALDAGLGDTTPSEPSAAGPTCRGARSVSFTEVTALRHTCRISLGPCDYFGDGFVLEAEVPLGYEPGSSLGDALRDFAPEWWAGTYGRRGRMDAMDAMIVGGGTASSLHWPGLNFADPWRECLALALATIRSHAHVVDGMPSRFRGECAYTSAGVVARFATRDFGLFLVDCQPTSCTFPGLEPVAATIDVDRDGLVTASRDHTSAYFAFTYDPRWFGGLTGALLGLIPVVGPLLQSLEGTLGPTIFVAPGFTVHASLADYYFWWARKLHSRILDGTGSAMDAFVGMLCARCAIAEITEIAEFLFHEMGHLFPSGPWHCSSPFILFDEPQEECCQYVGQVMLYHFIAADLGLPRSLLPFGTDTPAGQGTRFQTASDGSDSATAPPEGETANHQVWEDLRILPASGDCAATELNARHCSMFQVPHRVEVTWSTPPACTASAATAGAVTWNAADSDACGEPGDPLWPS